MVIRKQYNIGQLKDELGEKIERAREGCTGAAVVDVIVAQEILEVLEETLRREQKHQTLESALTFIEKEDVTQTNLMEEHNKKPKCFGNYPDIADDDIEDCSFCQHSEACKRETKKKKWERK